MEKVKEKAEEMRNTDWEYCYIPDAIKEINENTTEKRRAEKSPEYFIALLKVKLVEKKNELESEIKELQGGLDEINSAFEIW